MPYALTPRRTHVHVTRERDSTLPTTAFDALLLTSVISPSSVNVDVRSSPGNSDTSTTSPNRCRCEAKPDHKFERQKNNNHTKKNNNHTRTHHFANEFNVDVSNNGQNSVAKEFVNVRSVPAFFRKQIEHVPTCMFKVIKVNRIVQVAEWILYIYFIFKFFFCWARNDKKTFISAHQFGSSNGNWSLHWP